jgi:hypothetical protein
MHLLQAAAMDGEVRRGRRALLIALSALGNSLGKIAGSVIALGNTLEKVCMADRGSHADRPRHPAW